MLLAGSFTEYPFFLLLEIFLRRNETGLLEVSSPKQSGYFYVKNGEIKDGKIGTATGAVAVEVAGSFVDGSFRFKPLEPADYARSVWEKSFGPNTRVSDTPHRRVEAFRTTVEQFRPYPVASFIILEGAVVSLAQRVLRQLRLYTPAAYHSLEKTGVSLVRLTLAYASAAYEISKRAQVRKKLMIGVRKALAASQIAPRGIAAILHKYARARKQSLQLPVIRKRAAIFQSLPQGVQNNISFAVIVLALGVVTAVTISQVLRTTQDHVDTVAATAEDIDAQAPPRHVSKARAKRRPRVDRQTPADKKTAITMAQEPKVLPQTAPVQAPGNVGDSDNPNKPLETTSEVVQTIPVVLQIENGRVSRASLPNRRPGMEGYEAAALRIARQRRYSKAGKHTETIVVKVTQPTPN
jgi:hypothetical protein